MSLNYTMTTPVLVDGKHKRHSKQDWGCLNHLSIKHPRLKSSRTKHRGQLFGPIFLWLGGL